MASNNHNDNPWEDQHSQHTQQYQTHNNPYQDQSHNSFNQQQPLHGQNTSSPWTQEPSQGLPSNGFYAPPDQQRSNPPHLSQGRTNAPGLPPRRTETDLALPTGQDRSHQIEVMQSYEAAGRKDNDDVNVETLQREFPKMDGSLIAAIYGDNKSLSAAREMLQALDEE